MSILENMIRNKFKSSLSPPPILNNLHLISIKTLPDITKKKVNIKSRNENKNIRNIIFTALDKLSERKINKKIIKNGKLISRKGSIFHVNKEKKPSKLIPIKSFENITASKMQKTFFPSIKKHRALNDYLIRDFKDNENNYDYIRTARKNQILNDEFYTQRQMKIERQTALNIAKFEKRKNKELFDTDVIINNEENNELNNSEINNEEYEKENEKLNENEESESFEGENYDKIDDNLSKNYKTIDYSFKTRNNKNLLTAYLTSSETMYRNEKKKLNEMNLKNAEIRAKTLSKQILLLNTEDLIDIDNQHEYVEKPIDLTRNPFFQDSKELVKLNTLPEEPESHHPKLVEPNLLHEVNLKKLLRQSKNKINVIKEGDEDLGLDNIDNVRKERKDIEYQYFKVLKGKRTPKFLKNNFNLTTVKRYKGVSGKYFGVAC